VVRYRTTDGFPIEPFTLRYLRANGF